MHRVQRSRFDLFQHLRKATDYPPARMIQKAKLTSTPVRTPNCRLLLQTPSSRTSHKMAPKAQKKPMIFPHKISSSPPVPPASVPSPSSAASPLPPELLESSQRSSERRRSAPVGMVSGVCACDWMAVNCERKLATSVGVKPALRRRSNPCGGAAGGRTACCVVLTGDDGEEARRDASSCSAASSSGVRWEAVKTEQ